MVTVPYDPTPRVGPATGGMAYSRAQLDTGSEQVTKALGGLAATWQKRNEENENFTALANYNQFATQLTTEAEEVKRSSPANGDGAAVNIMARVNEGSMSFLETVPDRLKPEYAARLSRLRGEYEADAIGFQWQAQDAFQTDVLKKQISEGAYAVAQDPTQLESWRANLTDFVNTSGFLPEKKTALLSAGQAAIESGALKAEARERPWAFGDFETRLARRESSGNPGSMNKWGYAGLYQFGAPRMTDLGLFIPTEGHVDDNWSKKAGGQEKWSGTFTIPGHPEVKTIQDFLSSPQAQRAAFQVHSKKMDEEISQRGLDKYIGQEVGGREVTREGLHAMIHLAGAGGAQAALEGKSNPRDANGTSALDYLALGGGDLGISEAFANVPPEQRAALISDGIAEADALAVEARKQAKVAYDQQLNVLSNNLNDGVAGQADINAAREAGWLRDYDDINKMENILRSNREKVGTVSEALGKLNDPNKLWDPTDADDKKRNNVLFESMGTAERIAQRDDNAINSELLPLIGRTGMIPAPAVGALVAMSRSPDPQNVNWAFSKMDQLEKYNSRAFMQDVPEQYEKDLMRWRSLREYMPPDKIAEEFAKSREPGQAAARDRLEKEATALLKDVDTSEIVAAFDPGLFSTEPGLPRMSEDQALLRHDFEERFKEMWAQSGGDLATAKANTIKLMQRDWGIDSTSGEPRLMKYAPETFFKNNPAFKLQDTSWMRQQVEEQFGSKAFLVSDQTTAEEWSRGELPSYLPVKIDENGLPRAVLPGEQRVRFDVKKEIARAQQELTEADTLRRAFEQREMKELYGIGEIDPALQEEAQRVERMRQEKRVGDFKARNPQMTVPNADR